MDGVTISKDSERSRLMVLSDSFEVPLICEGSTWSVGVYDADDLKDNFVRVTDESEVSRVLQAAEAELSSNPSLSKAAAQASSELA